MAEDARTVRGDRASGGWGARARPRKELPLGQTIDEVRKAFVCFRRIAAYCRAYRYRLFVLALLAPISAFAPLLTPWLMQLLIDKAYPTRDLRLLGWLCVALLAVDVLSRVFSTASRYNALYVQSALEYRLSFHVFNAIQQLPQSYRDQRGFGVFLVRGGSDVQTVAQSVTRLLPEIVAITVTFIAAIPLMMRLSVEISLIMLAAVPLNYLITAHLTGRVVSLSMAGCTATEKIATFLQETVEGATLSRLFFLSRIRRKQLRELLRERLDIVFATWRTNTFWGQLAALVSAAWSTVLLCGGWYLVFSDRLQLGQAVALGMYVNILTRPFDQLGRLYQSFLADSVAVRRILEVLDAGQSVVQGRSRKVLKTPPRHYELRGLSFGYTPQRLCLQNVDLNLRTGQTIAVVGPTGGGKSTLIRILSGLEDRYTGRFLVDGCDFREVDPNSYLRHVTLVPQTTFFFSGSIRGNLPGNGATSVGHLRKYATILGLDAVIDSTPDGFDTRLGCEGIRLSAGQYQKLAALRAMLKDAHVLLLDEATASMDIESERKLLQGIVALRPPDCLTLLVTHHVSIAAEPWIDEIVVLMNGCIIEKGSHAGLCQSRGFYYHLLSLNQNAFPAGTDPIPRDALCGDRT